VANVVSPLASASVGMHEGGGIVVDPPQELSLSVEGQVLRVTFEHFGLEDGGSAYRSPVCVALGEFGD
jgi:hypothetical protein